MLETARESPFQRLTKVLRWRPDDWVLVLSVYLDESGIHDRHTGRPTTLALGGCLAQDRDWLAFDSHWRAALDHEGVDWFHMVDFESHDPKVSYSRAHWSEERHREFLNSLLDVIHQHVKSIVGAACVIPNPKAKLSKAYLADVTGVLHSTLHEARFWAFPSQAVKVVFADHPEIKGSRIGQYYNAIRAAFPGRLDSFSIEQSKNILPLQAADLVAYEIAHFLPREDWWNARYPMKRLQGRHRVEIGMARHPDEPTPS